MVSAGHRHAAILTHGFLARAVCEAGTAPFAWATVTDAAPDTVVPPARAGHATGANARVPKAFMHPARGLWAGCPSLARVRAALPDPGSLEGSIFCNDATGKTVIAALVQRKCANPGPSGQVSCDAVRARSFPAGRPAPVTITAPRQKEETPVAAMAADASARTGAADAGRTDPGAVPAVSDTAAAWAGAPVMDPDASAREGRAGALPSALARATGGASGYRPGIMSHRHGPMKMIKGSGYSDLRFPLTDR